MTKTKLAIALAAFVVAGGTSLAQAAQVHRHINNSVQFEQRDVSLPTSGRSDAFEVDRADRASSPYAGGGY